MTSYPPPPGDGSGWVDPDAPTGLSPQHQRPQGAGWQPPPGPPPSHQPPWPGPPGQVAPQGTWPQQPSGAQQPWPGAPMAGMPYGGFAGQPGPPPAKSRKPVFIALAVAVVVVVVGVIAIVAFSGNADGPGDGQSASDVAKAYLEALSKGDAATALSYGSAQPASTELLTDDILRKQIAKLPITNVRILDDDSRYASIGTTTVHVAVNFGQVVNDVKLDLKNSGDGWKLETAAVKIDAPYGADKDGANATVTVFGKNFKNGSLYTFPGYQDIGSSNQYIKATAAPLLLDQLKSYAVGSLQPTVTLNDEGRRIINDQLVAAFANCQRSNLLAPPGCPVKRDLYDGVEGTATWGPADLSNVVIGDISSYDMNVSVNGVAEVPLAYQTKSRGVQQDVARAYLFGDADITKTPPALNLG